MDKNRKVAWLLALVLGSGALLLAFGLVALWNGARDAERVAEAELRRSAQATARAVREALLDPELVARSPRERTLRVDATGLVLPPEVGWLDAPPPAVPPPAERAALRLEFAGGDRQAARALLARDAECALAAAWCAQRDGDATARDALLEHAEADPSWLLLFARAGRPFPGWAEAAVRVLEPDHAEALLDRVAELDPARDVAALRSAVRESARWRESLRTARACGAQESAFVARLAGDDLVVAHRPLAKGERTGVVLPLRATLDALAREARPPWSGTVVVGPARDEAAATALEGAIHVLPAPAPRTAAGSA